MLGLHPHYMLHTIAQQESAMISEKQRTELAQKQAMLKNLYRAWLAEKRKHAVITVVDSEGNLIEHHPDGSQRAVGHVKQPA